MSISIKLLLKLKKLPIKKTNLCILSESKLPIKYTKDKQLKQHNHDICFPPTQCLQTSWLQTSRTKKKKRQNMHLTIY